jgi:hypothetical protein
MPYQQRKVAFAPVPSFQRAGRDERWVRRRKRTIRACRCLSALRRIIDAVEAALRVDDGIVARA